MSQGKAPVNPQTPDERAIVQELQQLRGQLAGYSDKRFHEKFLSDGDGYSYSAWIRAQRDQWTGNTRALIAFFAAQIPKIKAHIARDQVNKPRQGADNYHILPDVQAVLDAIAIAKRNKNEKRLVMWVAGPGQGKSALLNYLQQTEGAILTAATQAWKRSYCSGLREIAHALGVYESIRDTYSLEQAVFHAGREHGRRILCIDDANTFGDHTCNMVRDLCNETMLTMVTASTAVPFNQKGKGGYQEGEQMRRRAVSIVKARPIEAEDVAPFLAWAGLNGTADQAFNAIKDAARMYNQLDFVVSVSNYLKLRHKPGNITLEQVCHAIEAEAKKLQRGDK
jgi:hypothetical protein